MPLMLQAEPELVWTVDIFKSINKKVTQELLSKDIGVDAYNIRYDTELGSISKRKNRAKYGNMSTLGTSQVLSMFRYYKNSDSTKTYIISYDTTLKKGTDSTGAFTNIKTDLTADQVWKFLTYKDRCYMINGTDTNQIYDGSNCEDMGVPVATAPTLAVVSGGSLTGAYYYKVTYMINSYQEGSSSVASSIINPSSESVTVTIPVSANSRVTHRKIYRTKAGGGTYYFLATVSDNTTTTYSDNIADSSLDTTILAPTDYGVPGVYRHLCLHNSRIFLARNSTNKSDIIFCDVRSGTAYPDVYPVDNLLHIGLDDGDEITFLLEDNYGQLIVGKENSIRKINTDSDSPKSWSIGDILSTQGNIGHTSSCATPWGIFYLTKYGEQKKRLMRFSGNILTPVLEEIEPILTAIPDTRLDDIVLHYHNGVLKIAYPDVSAGDTFNNRVMEIDLVNNNSISIDKKNVSSFCSWNSGTDSGELYSGTSDTTGFCYREDTESFDLEITLKSEIDRGTFGSYAESGGTESAPTIILKSGISGSPGASIISTNTTVISTLTGDEDTIKPCGVYTSSVLEINATKLETIHWNETLGSYGDIWFWIRTGESETACEAASWSGPYQASGADISAVTAARYIQYKCKLFITAAQVANYAQVYLSLASGYFVKIVANKGTKAETSINMNWKSGRIDFRELGVEYKRTRKRLRYARISFNRSAESGTLDFKYYLDRATTVYETVSIDLSIYASQGYYVHYFPLGVFCKDLAYEFDNSDAEDLTIRALEMVLTPEPIISFL